MKRNIVRVINSILKILGICIVKSDSDFQMSSALKRICDHKIKINSVIDIGASNGKWSQDAMKVFPYAKFMAIEPLEERKKALQKMKVKSKKFIYEMCVAGANNNTEVNLAVTEDLDGSTINGVSGLNRKMPVNSIDYLVHKNELIGPFLIKFDTHGYEVPILEGSKDTLKQTSIIIMEVYNFNITDNSLRFHEICDFMENLGFRCYDIAGPLLRKYDNAFWQMDIFFINKSSEIFSYSQYN